MSWLLNAIYAIFLIAGAPWLLWRTVVQGKNRRGWGQKLLGNVKPRKSNRPCLWLHAVSVGEVNLIAPILKHLKEANPDWEVVISTTTESGFELAQKKYADSYVFFCPFDFSWAIKRVLYRLRPNALVLAELELWPNLIRTVRGSGLPVAVVNGRLSEPSFRGYQKIRWLIVPTIKRLSWVGAQNQTYSDRFVNLGCDSKNIRVTGSVKFDGLETDRNNEKTQSLARLAGLRSDDFVWVAGSTQLEEDLIIAKTYQQLSRSIPNLKLVLVPRHPERSKTLATHLNEMGIPTRLRSTVTSDCPSPSIFSLPRHTTESNLDPILIVDVIGELGGWWGCADIAYVGGSMGRRGGQNMIEPAAFAIPVSFGPQTDNFKDIVEEFLEQDAATVVHDQHQIETWVRSAFLQPESARQRGLRAQTVVFKHTGASQRTLESLCQIIDGLRDSTENQSSIHAA